MALQLKNTLTFPLAILPIVLVYLITSYFSSGFHHPDEHYQIIHWANFKLGAVKINEMPWEFTSQIRSGFQPAICYIIFVAFAVAALVPGSPLSIQHR